MENGLISFAVVVGFVAAVYRVGLRNVDGWSRDWSRALSLVGCTSLPVHSFFDFNLQIPANTCSSTSSAP